MSKTHSSSVISGLGGFGGLFSLAEIDMEHPVLVSGTDGVGTKLAVAIAAGRHNTVGIDAVAMVANDVVAMGAKPLFFLDYISCGKLNPDVMEEIVSGMAVGCLEAGCALIGGEIAEHPGLMPEDEYDIAGFCVGIIEKSKIVTGESIRENDVIIGLASSGVHSNGFSLIRKIAMECSLDFSTCYFSGVSLADALLTPTKIYVRQMTGLLREVSVMGIAHITGGGFFENIPRILPTGLRANVQVDSWDVPEVFKFIQEKGGISDEEMYGLFNMGIGMTLFVREKDTCRALELLGQGACVIGKVEKGGGVRLG